MYLSNVMLSFSFLGAGSLKGLFTLIRKADFLICNSPCDFNSLNIIILFHV